MAQSMWFPKLLPVTERSLLRPLLHHTTNPLLHSSTTSLRQSNLLPRRVSTAAVSPMESITVLMTCPPVHPYLVEALEKRFTLHKLDSVPDKAQFLSSHRDSIRAVVGNAAAGADAELIDQLPKLEIVSSYSVGLDKIDLAKCKEKGIRVTNTPDVLTDDVADLALGLMLAVLRRLCESDRYVRSGLWKKGDYKLTTKVQWQDSGDYWLRQDRNGNCAESRSIQLPYQLLLQITETWHQLQVPPLCRRPGSQL
ncbi:unnamed protein product [Linum tenue]|uniref:D-isomer specific 2-hydroxyacid dehydrogenase catalytic domain-containing protein n=1 Tax=Linum tenue TaxID=586396 RepID=A0AAV0KLC9_9ROSI|nr:unnamed protein product [Linum tenue]